MSVAPASPALINAGELIHRVEIQEKTKTTTTGRHTATWATVVTWWMRVYEGTGREFHRAQQTQAAMTHLVKMHYYSGLDPDTHRLLWGTRELGIVGIVNPDGMQIVHMVSCKEKTSGS